MSIVHSEADWLTLDNAAKIYPTASSKLSPTVFRLSAMLRAPVRLSALQQASDALVRRCPYFQVYLRRGLFWYYLQRHRDTPRVQLLDRSSLESLPAGGKTEHLLRIRARGRTIAVDFSHILTDGAGGLRFFRSLLAEYLLLLHRHRLLLLVAETVLVAIVLQALDLLLRREPWFLTLALPVTVLAGTFIGGVSALVRALRPRVFAILAVVLVCAGLFLLGLETVVSLYLSGAFRLSWSLLILGCITPLVGLALYIQYRLKITSDDLGKIFHL